MSFSVNFTTKAGKPNDPSSHGHHGDAEQQIHSGPGAAIPLGIKQLLHNVVMKMPGDKPITVAASGHFDEKGGNCTVKVSQGDAASDTAAAPAPAKPGEA